MKFKYVGLKKDGERAFQDKTGIEWMPGAEHDVADIEVAGEMLKHPTIWEPLSDASQALAAAKPAPLRSTGPASDEEVDQEIDRANKAQQESKGVVSAAVAAVAKAVGKKSKAKK